MLRRAAFGCRPLIDLIDALLLPSTSAPTFHGFCSKPSAFQASVRSNLFNAPPASLAFDRHHAQPKPEAEQSALRRAFLRLAGFYSRESSILRGGRGLYSAVTDHVDDPRFPTVFGLPHAFATTHALLTLHVWLLLARLRQEGRDGKDLSQMLYDNFAEDVERRVRAEGVKVCGAGLTLSSEPVLA